MSNDKRAVLYINIIVHDASEAVKASIDNGRANPIRKRVAKVASGFATPSVVAGRIGAILCKKMTKKMKDMGLTVEIDEVFREANFLVLQMQLQHVDTITVAPNSFVEKLEWFFRVIGNVNQENLEANFLPAKIQLRMQPVLDGILTKKMAETKLEASSKVLSESKQARFFYATLREVRESKAAEKASKGPLASFKRKRSSS